MISLIRVFAILSSLFCVLTVNAQEAKLIEFWDESEPTSKLRIDHSVWQSILDKYLDSEHASGINRFDYSAVTEADKQAVLDYIDYLESFDPRQLNRNEQFAYWVNFYNVGNVAVVLTREIESSIREIRSGFFSRGPWGLDLFTVVTKELSLNDIEHGILRPIWQDPRIHYVVNCASISCPDLDPRAFTADNIEQILEDAARSYVNHPRALTIKDSEIVLSSIYDWYADDFGSNSSQLFDHIRAYLNDEKRARLDQVLASDPDISYEYDWDLNKQ
jgi:hypothetical protein